MYYPTQIIDSSQGLNFRVFYSISENRATKGTIKEGEGVTRSLFIHGPPLLMRVGKNARAITCTGGLDRNCKQD